MTVVISDNPKIIKKFIQSNGQVIDGEIYDIPQGDYVASITRADSTPKKARAVAKDKEGEKICLGCSSVAKEGFDYCSSCLPYIK